MDIFLKNEMIRDDFKAKGLKKAKETLDIMKLNDKERIAYNRKLENKSLEKSLFKTAVMEGEYRGEKRGLKKGKIEVAKNLLNANMDIKFISNITGLSVEEIEQLKRLK